MAESLQAPELPPIGFVTDLSQDDRLVLSSYGQFTSAQQGQIIVTQGETQNSLYLVISGKLEARRVMVDKEIKLGEIGVGESFGEVNLFDPSPATATVVAAEFSQIWKINLADLEQFLETSPVAGGNLLVGIAQELSRRLRDANRRLLEARTAILRTSYWE